MKRKLYDGIESIYHHRYSYFENRHFNKSGKTVYRNTLSQLCGCKITSLPNRYNRRVREKMFFDFLND
jgi:hypothetical protein